MTSDKCKKCGALLAETDMFCMHCGQKRQVNEVLPAVSQKQEPQQNTEEGLKCAVCNMSVQPGDVFCGECGAPLMHTAGRDDWKTPLADTSVIVHDKSKINGPRRIFPIIIVALLVAGVAGTITYKALGVGSVNKTPGVPKITASEAGRELVETPVENAAELHIPKIPASEIAASDTSNATQEIEDVEIAWGVADASGYSAVQIKNTSGQISNHWLPGVITGDRVNFRTRPNTNAQVLEQFNKGDRLVVLGRLSRSAEKYPWYRVESGGKIGWLYGQFLMAYDL